jgi:cytochrome c oxidase subunit 2
MMVLDGLPRNRYGYFRLLETNKRVILPTNTHLRLLVSAVDVLHSWTVPSFGLKVDACPGRLNQVNLFIKRIGVFFGQCSEICGVNHGFMPIVIVALPTLQFHSYIMTKLEFSHS